MPNLSIIPATGHPSAATVLGAWQFDPLVVSGILLSAVLYLRAVRRVWHTHSPSAFPRLRVLSFILGLAVLYLALQSPIDTYADLLFSDHMGQHLLLTMVAAPLLVLGTPVTLALAAFSPRSRRRFLLPVLHSRFIGVVGSPLFAFALFAVVMWGSHLPPVFDAALRNETFHSLEHLAYLSSALLFWWPVVGLDPNPARPSHPARLLYLFLAMPVTALLGLAIYSSSRLLYPYYGPASRSIGFSPIADQHLAGATTIRSIMWEGGMLLMVVALALVLLDWMRRDEREAERADARLARAAGAQAAGQRLGEQAST